MNLQKLQHLKPQKSFESHMFFMSLRNLSGSQEMFYCTVSLAIINITLSESFVNFSKS